MYAQKEADQWVFDNHVFDFSSGKIKVVDSLAKTYYFEPDFDKHYFDKQSPPIANICDDNGKLLFYSVGTNVFDNKHDTLENGTGIKNFIRNWYSTSVIVPVGIKNKKYYLFTIPYTWIKFEDTAFYSTIELNKSTGKFSVTQKNIPLFKNPSEGITATKHANGIDTWVLMLDGRLNQYHAYLVSECGIAPPVKTYIPSINIEDNMIFSPNGKYLYSRGDTCRLYNFDNSTGKLTYNTSLQKGSVAEYYAFTSDSKNIILDILNTPNYKYSYNIATKQYTPVGFPASKLQSWSFPFHDGYNYYTEGITNNIRYINKTDLSNPQKPIVKDSISYRFFIAYGDSLRTNGLAPFPSFITSYLDPDYAKSQIGIGLLEIKSNKVCVGDSTKFQLKNTRGITQYWWQYGNGDSANTSLTNYKYKKAGIYKVRLIVLYNCLYDTVYTTVQVDSIPSIDIGQEYQCAINSIKLSANENFDSYLWDTGDTSTSIIASSAKQYKITVGNACGFTADSVKVQLIKHNIELSTNRTCVKDTTKIQVNSLYPISKYTWQYGNGISDSTTNKYYIYPIAGIYNLKLIAFQNCFSDTASTQVIVDDTPILNLGDSILTCKDEVINLDAGKGFSNYLWQDGSKNQTFTAQPFKGSETLEGFAKVTVTNACGSQTDSIKIKKVQIWAPNIITPNDDGKNETLEIKSPLNQPVNLQIHNRWGQEVYQSDNYKNDWSAKNLSEGVYYFNSHYEGCPVLKGWVQVAR